MSLCIPCSTVETFRDHKFCYGAFKLRNLETITCFNANWIAAAVLEATATLLPLETVGDIVPVVLREGRRHPKPHFFEPRLMFRLEIGGNGLQTPSCLFFKPRLML